MHAGLGHGVSYWLQKHMQVLGQGAAHFLCVLVSGRDSSLAPGFVGGLLYRGLSSVLLGWVLANVCFSDSYLTTYMSVSLICLFWFGLGFFFFGGEASGNQVSFEM